MSGSGKPLARRVRVEGPPVPARKGKCMSRRTGQNGYIEKSGRWYVVRFWKDVDDRKRVHVRERICPISGAGSLKNAKDRKERAKRIIYESGVDSPEYFDKVVRQISSGGVTFREQSEICLKHLQTRKREPIGENYARSIQGGDGQMDSPRNRRPPFE